jgi:hypothetical protein
MAINFRSRQIQAPPTTGQQPLPMRAAYQGASDAWEGIGNAAARAGYAVAEPLLEKAQVDASSKTINAQVEYEKRLNDLKLARAQSNNPDGWEADLNSAHTEFLGDIKQKIPYRRFADAFVRWAGVRKEREREGVLLDAENKRRDLRNVDLTLNVNTATGMGNKKLVETLYKTAAANGDISNQYAAAKIMEMHAAIDKMQYEAAKDSVLGAARQVFDTTGSVTKASQSVWENPAIAETDKRELDNMVKSYASTMKSAADEANYRKKEAFKKEIIPLKFSDDPLQLQEARDRMVKEGSEILTAEEIGRAHV